MKPMIEQVRSILAVVFFISQICVGECFGASLEYAPAYDGRTAGIITPVKDQGTSSLCWAYASVNAAEASVLKSGIAPKETAETLSLSPLQLGYARHNRGADPLANTTGEKTREDWYYATGNSSYAPALFSQWCGPTDSSLPKDCNGWENAEFIQLSSVTIDGSALDTDADARLALKEAILQYGAVTFSYNNVRESYYYNPSKETGGSAYPHACTIIGWDDTIPANSFLPGGATQNGGWLVKNSYDSLPYFYLSYDNVSSNIYAFSFAKREDYAHNYFYDSDARDFGLGAILRPRHAANVFRAKEGGETEYVLGVNIGIEGKNTQLSVQVYTNLTDESKPIEGNPAAVAELTVTHGGYYTVEFSEPVPVEEGSLFSVVAQITTGDGAYIKITQNSGMSFLNRNGAWNESPYAPRLKAYTGYRSEKLFFTDHAVCVNTNEADGGVLMICYYSKTRMEDFERYPLNAASRYFYIPEGWKKTNEHRIRAFLWQSDSVMRPIAQGEYKKQEN